MEITLKAYSKINLSIDVVGKRACGYHDVSMVLHQIELWDRVTVKYKKKDYIGTIEVTTDDDSLPVGNNNIAWKAADIMAKTFSNNHTGDINVHIEKRIPVGAGLGGGSADAAAVLHGLNTLWKCEMSLGELIEIGRKIGADVPFCLMGQAAKDISLIHTDETVSTCALAEGIGEVLTPLPPLESFVILSKPDIFVSTEKIYKNLKLEDIKNRPNTDVITCGLKESNFQKVSEAMYNVLEDVSMKLFPGIEKEKKFIERISEGKKAIMSGSGPTIIVLVHDKDQANRIYTKSLNGNQKYLRYLVATSLS